MRRIKGLRKASTARLVAVGTVTALAMTLAACGGDDSSNGDTTAGSETTATGGNAASGNPIKVMLINPVDNPIIDWGMSNTDAEAAAEAINADGGVGGRPLKILTCNERVDPNQAVVCAREAVSEDVAAVYMNSLFSSAIFPILEDAEIPAVGSLVTETIDFESPMAFPIVPGTNLLNGAWPGVLVDNEAPRIGGVVAGRASTATDVGVMEEGAAASGADFAGAVGIPETQTDYSTPVEQIKDLDADASIVLLSEGPAVQLLKTASDLAFETTWATNSYTFFPSSLTTLGGAAEGIQTLDPLPPATASEEFEGVAKFNEELEAAGATDEDDRALPGMQAWLAVHAIAMVGDKVSGEVNSETLLAELNKGEPVQLFDLIEWTPGGKGPGEYTRLSNGNLFLSVYEGGELTASPDTVDGFAMAGVK